MRQRARVAIDSDIFFFAISDSHKEKENRRMAETLLNHLKNHPDYEVLVPISVLGEVVIKCLDESVPRNLNDLHLLADMWAGLDIGFVFPNDAVARICYHIMDKYKDERLSPTDRVHLGYALAYNMNYLVTTDMNLQRFPVPPGRDLEIMSLKKALEIIRR